VPELKQFKLPDVGEGLTEAEIVSWKVKPGDTVKINDVIVEIETAKSLVELPSPYAGVVSSLLVEEGQTVDVGTPIIAVDTSPSAGAAPAAAPEPAPARRDDMLPPAPPAEGAVEPGLIGGPAPGGRTSVLVGYGPRATEAKRRPRKSTADQAADGSSAAVAHEALQNELEPDSGRARTLSAERAPSALPSVHRHPTGARDDVAAVPTGGADRNVAVLAKPPVRKLAKSLGVDLAAVTPSGAGGVITRADVEAAARGALVAAEAPGVPAYEPLAAPVEVGGRRETRVPIRGVRKMTAQAMVASAFTAPHVTEWVTVDITRTMQLLDRLKGRPEFEGVRISPLLLVMKALITAIRRNPEINASWDEQAQEIVIKHYVNLGIAAATPRGLIVPNIKDAQDKSLPDLARALNELIATAREGRTPPQDMSGGTITITNVGVFGVDGGTPILNPPESAILAFGAVRDMPWVVDGEIVPRKVTQLALSFDHRLIDGELGSRFLSDLARLLEDPELALVWG
jgi:2-oxoisovalerate dehydrogenase E2 component (dihydrolipoyl transacylase)